MTDGRHPLIETLFIVLGWPWLETLGTIVSALAWPAAVVILVLILRPQVRALMAALAPRMKHLRKVTGPLDLSAEWASEVEELEEEVETLTETGASTAPEPAATPPDDREDTPDPRPYDSRRLELYRLAEVHAESAIIGAWKRVERAIREHLVAQGELGRGNLVRQFTRLGSTPDWVAAPVYRLFQLRNEVTHSDTYDVDVEAAKSYISTALKMVDEIHGLPVHPQTGRTTDSASSAGETSMSGGSGGQ